MIKPTIPKNDDERILQLLSYDILDTASENDYDELTKLAAELAKTPIALVSLIDTNRQWFKSCYGLSGVTETDRSISFCGHAINYKEIFIVDNVLNDERFKDNPLVTGEPNIRFYAGIPLIDSEGFTLGTLCVIDTKENSLSDLQQKQLKVMAQQVVKIMELRKTNLKIKENYKELFDLSKKNIEQKKQLEQALDQAAKLSVIGELAASIVHEIKNPLFIIGTTCEILYSGCENDNSPLSFQVKESVKSIDDCLDRVDKIIKGLSKNSRTVKDEFKQVVVLEVISDCLAMMSGKIKKQKVDIKINCDSKLSVFGRHSDLSQVVVNLISNALDAISDLKDRNKWIKIFAIEDKEYVKISIIDCGDGIEKKVVDSIFNSFLQLKKLVRELVWV